MRRNQALPGSAALCSSPKASSFLRPPLGGAPGACKPPSRHPVLRCLPHCCAAAAARSFNLCFHNNFFQPGEAGLRVRSYFEPINRNISLNVRSARQSRRLSYHASTTAGPRTARQPASPASLRQSPYRPATEGESLGEADSASRTTSTASDPLCSLGTSSSYDIRCRLTSPQQGASYETASHP
jgi:hypothetical protein